MALVEIRNVHKSFQRDSQVIEVFEDLTLEFTERSFTSLMGPSGSGKSTLLNLVAGLDRPTRGSIAVAGATVSAMRPSALAAWRVRVALGVVGLDDRLQHYPRQLSGGQEQRVAIARAIVSDPTLILLDEPTGQLDKRAAEEVLALLQRLNSELHKTIIIVTHDAHAAEKATQVLHLDKGVLAA